MWLWQFSLSGAQFSNFGNASLDFDDDSVRLCNTEGWVLKSYPPFGGGRGKDLRWKEVLDFYNHRTALSEVEFGKPGRLLTYSELFLNILAVLCYLAVLPGQPPRNLRVLCISAVRIHKCRETQGIRATLPHVWISSSTTWFSANTPNHIKSPHPR